MISFHQTINFGQYSKRPQFPMELLNKIASERSFGVVVGDIHHIILVWLNCIANKASHIDL